MWNNRNFLVIRQQFRTYSRMTLDTFMGIVTLARNRLEKQDTRFREAVPIEKRVAIAFRSSHQRCSMKKGILKNFTKFTDNFGTTDSVLYGVQRLGNLTAELQKELLLENRLRYRDRLSKYFIKFPGIPSGNAKTIAKFKETANRKTPHAVSLIWAPATDFS